MKTTISFLIRGGVLAFTLFIFSCSFAQTQKPTAQIMIGNDTLLDARNYQFDVYISAKDANGVSTFNLKGFQGGFQENLKNVLNGGKPSISVVADGSSTTNREQTPNVALFKPSIAKPNFIQLNPTALQTIGTKVKKADDASTLNGWTKVCTIRITNSVAFAQDLMSVAFSKSKIYPTVLLANYKKPNPSNGSISYDAINNIYNPTLNLPLIKFNVTCTPVYSADASVAIGLNGSESKCAYKLVLNGVVQDQTELIGTGGPLTWEKQPGGNYTIVGRRIATYLKETMNGSVIIPGLNDGVSNYNVYPNPATDAFTIESKTNSGMNYFTIYNSIGQEVYKSTINGKTVVQASSYAPGVYFIKIENGNSTEVKKIIKN